METIHDNAKNSTKSNVEKADGFLAIQLNGNGRHYVGTRIVNQIPSELIQSFTSGFLNKIKGLPDPMIDIQSIVKNRNVVIIASVPDDVHEKFFNGMVQAFKDLLSAFEFTTDPIICPLEPMMRIDAICAG